MKITIFDHNLDQLMQVKPIIFYRLVFSNLYNFLLFFHHNLYNQHKIKLYWK